MSYSPEYKDGYAAYAAVLQHNETGLKANVMVTPVYTAPPEGESLEDQIADRDALFQLVLTSINDLGIFTVESASKYGNYRADVTP